MGFFSRVFSSTYRKAVAAEAAGNFLDAARFYGICKKNKKVSDMHLAQARREDSLEGRIRALRNALDFAGGDKSRRTLIQRLLAEALRRYGKRQGPTSDEGRQRLLEAAKLFDESDRHETAGDVYLEAGDVDHAVDAFSKAGLVARVEELLATQDLEETRRRRVESAFKDYEVYLHGGQRDQALEAISRCVDEAREKGDYRRLARHLEERILRQSRVELEVDRQRLWVLGRREIVLGRDASCEAIVRGPSVSRRHARILLQRDGIFLEDAGSRNGTLLQGLPIGARVELPPSATIGLGDSATLSLERPTDGPTEFILLRVTRGLDRDKRFLLIGASEAPASLSLVASSFPPLLVSFREGRPLVSAPNGGALMLNGQRVIGDVQIIGDDAIEIDGARVTVRG